MAVASKSFRDAGQATRKELKPKFERCAEELVRWFESVLLQLDCGETFISGFTFEDGDWRLTVWGPFRGPEHSKPTHKFEKRRKIPIGLYVMNEVELTHYRVSITLARLLGASGANKALAEIREAWDLPLLRWEARVIE